MRALRFALRLLTRDFRTGELRLMALSLVVAVGAVTAVSFFVDRVARLMEYQAAGLLAADVVLESPQPLPDALVAEASGRGLKTAHTLEFPSVVVAGEQTQLVQVKAVTEGYPLRGTLSLSETTEGPERETTSIPEAGTVWVESRLLSLLGIELGDGITLGERSFRVVSLIRNEPDRGGSLFRLAPRVLLRMSDIADTGLISPASRVKHRFLGAGPEQVVTDFKAWIQVRLPAGARVLDVRNARPELRSALEQGSRFLGLAALTTVLLAGAAVAVSCRRFVDRQADACALMCCLGATQTFVLSQYALRLLGVAIVSSVLGAGLGFAAQQLLSYSVGAWFGAELPPPSARPLLPGMATGLVAVLGFALPPLLRLGDVPPLRVFRRELGVPPTNVWVVSALAAVCFGGLVFWQAGDTGLAARVLAALASTVLLLLALSYLLVKLLSPLRRRVGAVWRYGLAALARHPVTSALQLTAFGLGITVLLLLSVVRIDLLGAWQQGLPPDAPNQFLINVQPDEVPAVRRHLAAGGVTGPELYPMVRARLMAVNGQQVSPEEYSSQRARRLASREFNLSWAERPQVDNRIVAGRWWDAGDRGAALLSVEEGLAESLGIRVGDRLEFAIAGESVEAMVANLRSVKWDSFNVNFFVVAAPGLLEAYPATYVSSFHQPPGQHALTTSLVRSFPSLTVIDVETLKRQVQRVIAQGAAAVEFVFLFTLAAGVVVLYAGIHATHQARRQEAAVLRTLGLRRRSLLLAIAVEFLTLGFLAGLLATISAYLSGWLLAQQVFQLPYTGSAWLWLLGVLGSTLGIGFAGTVAAVPLVTKHPLAVLRGA